MDREIKAVCKRCGKSSPANQFVLDTVYRMMVCPSCVRERKDKILAAKMQQEREKEKEQEPPRPPGWDAEDEYLDKLYKQREKIKVEFERIDENRVKYTCPKCKYKFVYDTVKKYPDICPYCKCSILTFKFRQF